LILDEFAWNHMDEPTVDWYESQHRVLVAAGQEPKGPPDLSEWRARHADLHPYEVLRAEVDSRYDERHFEWCPYFYRWLSGSARTSTPVTGAPASRSARRARSELPHITNCGVPFMKRATGSFWITSWMRSRSSVIRFLSS